MGEEARAGRRPTGEHLLESRPRFARLAAAATRPGPAAGAPPRARVGGDRRAQGPVGPLEVPASLPERFEVARGSRAGSARSTESGRRSRARAPKVSSMEPTTRSISAESGNVPQAFVGPSRARRPSGSRPGRGRRPPRTIAGRTSDEGGRPSASGQSPGPPTRGARAGRPSRRRRWPLSVWSIRAAVIGARRRTSAAGQSLQARASRQTEPRTLTCSRTSDSGHPAASETAFSRSPEAYARIAVS